MSIQYRNRILEINPDAILWDDMDECIIGITEEASAVYDIHKMELKIMELKNFSFEDASDWVEFNMLRTYLGNFTPVHVWTMPDEMID